jgi:hypothetical protein
VKVLELLAKYRHALQRVRQGHFDISKDSVVSHETAIKADKFLLVVHGTPDEAARAEKLLGAQGAASVEVHAVSGAALVVA